MSGEGFEEWDADFLDQLIQVEELALSSANPSQHHAPHSAVQYDDVSYSPPRELSQRVNDNTKCFDRSLKGIGHSPVSLPTYVRRSESARESEIDRLKKELGRVSKQLSHLEQECLELRKERDKKEEQLQSVFSQIEEKDAEVHRSKSKKIEVVNDTGSTGKKYVDFHEHLGLSVGNENGNSSNNLVDSRTNVGTSVCKSTGVQTEKSGDYTNSIIDDWSADRPSKLRAVWDSQGGRRSGRDLVSKLFVACEADFHVLFRCLNLGMPSQTTMDFRADETSSDADLLEPTPTYSDEAAKISHLYSMLTKIINGMAKLEDLIKVLLDLCALENVVIVFRSLHVLHMVLNHLISIEMKSDRRDNVMIEVTSSRNNTTDNNGSESSGTGSFLRDNTYESSDLGHFPFETRLLNAGILDKKELWSRGSTMSASCVDWVYLFELMHQITIRNKEENVRLEAVTIMNVILMRSDAYMERKRFGQVLEFQSVSELLKKEAGLHVQKQAVRFIYLLLNCKDIPTCPRFLELTTVPSVVDMNASGPQLMAMFCSGCKEEGESRNDKARSPSTFQGFSVILEGLADCVACCGSGTLELQLRRNAITLLAFIASSGKSGFEILLGHTIPRGTNFLTLILQILVSEIDMDASVSTQPSDICKERTLLIREALILLNRLVSNPQYSTPVLQVLTNSRDVACLATDIANRLSRKVRWLWEPDSMTRQMRESEIVDLARVFKRRVFTFLGENII